MLFHRLIRHRECHLAVHLVYARWQASDDHLCGALEPLPGVYCCLRLLLGLLFPGVGEHFEHTLLNMPAHPCHLHHARRSDRGYSR